MKKSMLVLLVLCSTLLAALNGNFFVNDASTFEVRMPDGWSQDLKNTRKEVVFVRGDGITEFAVDIIPLSAKQSNASNVAKDQVIAYDGWQYVAGREMGWNERHGGDSSFSVMYNKNILNRYSPQTKIIAQEFYFVKNRQVYVVTLITDSDHWNEAKASLLFAVDSFKIY